MKILVLGKAQIDFRLLEIAFHSIRHRGDPIQDTTDGLTKSRRALRHRFILEHLLEVVVEKLIRIILGRIARQPLQFNLRFALLKPVFDCLGFVSRMPVGKHDDLGVYTTFLQDLIIGPVFQSESGYGEAIEAAIPPHMLTLSPLYRTKKITY
jgi:hypothetical protein